MVHDYFKNTLKILKCSTNCKFPASRNTSQVFRAESTPYQNFELFCDQKVYLKQYVLPQMLNYLQPMKMPEFGNINKIDQPELVQVYRKYLSSKFVFKPATEINAIKNVVTFKEIKGMKKNLDKTDYVDIFACGDSQ